MVKKVPVLCVLFLCLQVLEIPTWQISPSCFVLCVIARGSPPQIPPQADTKKWRSMEIVLFWRSAFWAYQHRQEASSTKTSKESRLSWKPKHFGWKEDAREMDVDLLEIGRSSTNFESTRNNLQRSQPERTEVVEAVGGDFDFWGRAVRSAPDVETLGENVLENVWISWIQLVFSKSNPVPSRKVHSAQTD